MPAAAARAQLMSRTGPCAARSRWCPGLEAPGAAARVRRLIEWLAGQVGGVAGIEPVRPPSGAQPTGG